MGIRGDRGRAKFVCLAVALGDALDGLLASRWMTPALAERRTTPDERIGDLLEEATRGA